MSDIDKLADKYCSDFIVKTHEGFADMALFNMHKATFKAGALAERKRIRDAWPEILERELFLKTMDLDEKERMTGIAYQIDKWLRSKLLGDEKE